MVSSGTNDPLEPLSDRAREILLLLADGLSDREIAQKLILSINTVKWYNRQIYAFFDVRNRTQAVARARELQLLSGQNRPDPQSAVFSHTPKNNFPADVTRFIGRQRELQVLRRLVPESRIFTLTGPPGTGKTRLALQLGRELIDHFKDGVYFVSLASLEDPNLVGNAIAAVLGINERQGLSAAALLKQRLREQALLLILDNFEHLLPAANLISDLLRASDELTIVITSREPLKIYGEQEFPVPIMTLPMPDQAEPEMLAECESLTLFLERAQAVKPDFELTAGNALDVAKICVRLEGLPLAIELAAARIKLMTPKALLARLDSRLNTLTGGPRDHPLRHQTLRQTLDWSFKLLTDSEKKLFRRLSVFRGGRSRDAIEAVCLPELSIDFSAGVESLLNKNLLYQQFGRGEEPRFFMLETIHEYSMEQLEAADESEIIRQRHAAYFADLAAQAAPELRLKDSATWMERMESEIDNLRAALEWSLSGAEVDLGLMLTVSLRDFWVMSNRFSEGQLWTRRALTKSAKAPILIRSQLLTAAGYLLFTSTEPMRGKQYLEEAVALARESQDPQTLAWALTFLASASIGRPAYFQAAMEAAEEGLALFKGLNHRPGTAQVLNIIGELTRTFGEIDLAQAAYEECLALVRKTGEGRRESMILGNLGIIARHRGELKKARTNFKAAFIKAVEVGYDRHLLISQFVDLAGILSAEGDLKTAAHLFGATEALLEQLGVRMQPGNQGNYEWALENLRSQLDEKTLADWWAEGRLLTVEQATAIIIGLDS